MDFVIEQHIRAFGEKRKKGQYSEATIRNYVSAVRSLNRHVNGGKPFDDLDWARDQANVLKVVASIPNLQTRRNLINGLIASLQTMGFPIAVITPYEGARDLYNAQYQASGFATEKQALIMKAVSKADINTFLAKEILDATLTENNTRFSAFTILSIHTAYPFRNELGDMKFIRRVLFDKMSHEEKKENNWLILEKGFGKQSFALTRYKTHSYYGTKEIDVLPKYATLIHKISQVRGLKLATINHQPLFVSSAGDAFTPNKVSKHLADYTTANLGNPISTTLMAKIFGAKVKDPSKPTPAELDALKQQADIRGHSLVTRFLKYTDV
tara:strand:+ start:1043 stop:2020 length:978 start_codon:yes stop_codon:yes gene_type:complete